MNRFCRYVGVQFKRTLKAYLHILPAMMALLLLVAVIGGGVLLNRQEDASFTKVSVGVVGDKEDQLLKMGLTLIREMDTSRLTVEFVEFYDEDKAVNALTTHQLDAYLVVPKGFAQAVVRGNEKPIHYVMAKRSADISAVLTRDVVDVVANYIIETQAGVTAMCDYARDLAYSREDVQAINMDMSLRYIHMITERESFVTVEEIGVGASLSFYGYYICGLSLFFLLCFGITCCTLRVKTNRTMDKWLYARGYVATTQVVGEYIPYLFTAVLVMLVPAGVAGVLSLWVAYPVPELTYWLVSDYLLLAVKLLPAILAITALQFLLYELVSGVINGALVQFMVALLLGYVGGCFYPRYFLPDAVQQLVSALPIGVAFDYFGGLLGDRVDWPAFIGCLVYGLGLLAITVAVRYTRIRVTEDQG